MSWTDERVELLKKLWTEGLSASQIAGRLGNGVTRNAVIGKVHRLNLSGRVQQQRVAQPRQPRKQREPSLASRAGETSLRADVTERVAPGVVYTTFHHPDTQVNVITTDHSDWATNCPEYKVTAVQVALTSGRSNWQEEYNQQAEQSRRIEHDGELIHGD